MGDEEMNTFFKNCSEKRFCLEENESSQQVNELKKLIIKITTYDRTFTNDHILMTLIPFLCTLFFIELRKKKNHPIKWQNAF